MVCLPSLLSRPPALSPDVRIKATLNEQEFSPFVWNSEVTRQLKRYQVPTSVSLKSTNVQQDMFWNSCNTGTSSCCFLHKCIEANLSPRILPSSLLRSFGPIEFP